MEPDSLSCDTKRENSNYSTWNSIWTQQNTFHCIDGQKEKGVAKVVVESASFEIFNNRLNVVLGNLFCLSLLEVKMVKQMISIGQLHVSVNLCKKFKRWQISRAHVHWQIMRSDRIAEMSWIESTALLLTSTTSSSSRIHRRAMQSSADSSL